MAFTFFFRDAQTLELLVEQALPETMRPGLHPHFGRRLRPRAGAVHAGHAVAGADIGLRLSQRADSRHRRGDPVSPLRITAGIYAEQEVERMPEPDSAAVLPAGQQSRGSCK